MENNDKNNIENNDSSNEKLLLSDVSNRYYEYVDYTEKVLGNTINVGEKFYEMFDDGSESLVELISFCKGGAMIKGINETKFWSDDELTDTFYCCGMLQDSNGNDV